MALHATPGRRGALFYDLATINSPPMAGALPMPNRLVCRGCHREIGGRGKLPADGLCADCRRRAKKRGGIPEGGFPRHQTAGDPKRLWVHGPIPDPPLE